MSDQICLLSDQNGALVGHMSFQEEKNYLQPCYPGGASPQEGAGGTCSILNT